MNTSPDALSAINPNNNKNNSANGETPPEFHPFPDLPMELKIMILEAAIKPRTLLLDGGSSSNYRKWCWPQFLIWNRGVPKTIDWAELKKQKDDLPDLYNVSREIREALEKTTGPAIKLVLPRDLVNKDALVATHHDCRSEPAMFHVHPALRDEYNFEPLASRWWPGWWHDFYEVSLDWNNPTNLRPEVRLESAGWRQAGKSTRVAGKKAANQYTPLYYSNVFYPKIDVLHLRISIFYTHEELEHDWGKLSIVESLILEGRHMRAIVRPEEVSGFRWWFQGHSGAKEDEIWNSLILSYFGNLKRLVLIPRNFTGGFLDETHDLAAHNYKQWNDLIMAFFARYAARHPEYKIPEIEIRPDSFGFGKPGEE